MSLPRTQTDSLLKRGFSRRDLGRIAGLLTAGAAFPFYNEFAMAQDAQQRMGRGAARRAMDPDAVRINQNENPLGPCKEGLEAIAKIAPYGGRYSPFSEQGDLVTAIAETEGVKESYVAAYAGSSDPLHRASCAFTSPTQSWVMADPGYGGGAPAFIGSKVTRVPLRADYTHDVEAMIKADPDGGVFYVCNPNNPSGTVTPRKDIEYLLANKKKEAVVLIDEAYIHFADTVQPASDLVAADKDVIVLRTFSKVYGMAGIRAGFAHGASGPAGEDPPVWRGLRAGPDHEYGLRHGQPEGQGRGGRAQSNQQTHPREYLRIPGKEGREIYPQRNQLLHDGSGQARPGIRAGNGGAESDHRARVECLANKGSGDGGHAG